MKRAIKVYFFTFFLLVWNVYSQHSQWKSYTDGNIVTELAVEGESVWIGTSASGLAYLDHPGGSLIYYNTDNSELPDNRIKSIAIDHEGMKWIGAKNGGVSRFDGENWTIYNFETSDISGDRAEAIAFDNDGNMWVGFKSNGLDKYDGNNWINYTSENSDLPMNQVNCIAFDDNNTKWIGCDHLGLAKFDDHTWTIYNSDSLDMTLDRILCIAFNDSGHKIIGTEYDGLLKYDDVDWFNYHTEIPELYGGLISSMAFDSSWTLWYTTWYGGLTRLDGFNRTIYTPDNSGLPHINARVVVIDENNTKWIGTEIGLVAFNENGISDVKHNKELSPNHFSLKQNFPNPFNPVTTIGYSLQQSDKISLKIYNLTGQKIETLIDGFQIAGEHEIKWKPEGLPSGIYFYRLQSGEFSDTKKLVLHQ